MVPGGSGALLKLLGILFLCATVAHSQGIITTVAGTGWTFRGDGGPATAAPLGETRGIAVDGAGNVYVADNGNYMVFKITPAGTLAVVADNGFKGFSGDGGPATSASLLRPYAVALDASGNLYIADSIRVRRVTPEGIIRTLAGGGPTGHVGDGGPATSATFVATNGLAVDAAGNVYISDEGANRVRKVSPNGVITTFAGTGAPGFSGDNGPAASAALFSPAGLAVDRSGNVYIADALNGRIRRVSTSGIITTIAGGGAAGPSEGSSALSVRLGQPRSVALDNAGNLFVADQGNTRVYRISSAGILTTAAGSTFGFGGDDGPATSAAMDGPVGVALDASGNLYIADSGNERIRKVAGGIITTFAGNGVFKFAGDGGPAASASLNFPRGVALDASGNLFVADALNHRVRKVSAGGVISTVAGTGIRGTTGDNGPAINASMNRPGAVATDAQGNIYVSETLGTVVRKIGANGVITRFAGNGQLGFSGDNGPATSATLRNPNGVAIDSSGNLYIADTANSRVRKVNTAGVITTFAGGGSALGDGGSATSAMLTDPQGVAVDASGNVYIAEARGHRVRKVAPAGTISTIAGTGVQGFSGDGGPATSARLNFPTGVAVDRSGVVYIADGSNQRIRRVALDGAISTVAGNGFFAFFGDGGISTSAKLASPAGVAVNEAGSIFIVDQNNDRIRQVLASSPTLSVSPTSLSFSAPAGSSEAVTQQISVSSSLRGLAFSVTQSGALALSVSPASGSSPGGVTVAAKASRLTAGLYRGTLTIQAPGATPPSVNVNVEFTVTAPQAATLSVQPSSLTFEANAGAGNPPAQTPRVGNGGGGTLNWNARTRTSAGGAWLVASPASGSASSDAPAAVTVSVNAGSLATGTYNGAVVVDSEATGESQTVSVTLLVRQAATLLVSQAGLLFIAVEGGGVVPSQDFAILNTGQGSMSWTAQVSTFSGGGWLTATPGAGVSIAGATQIPQVDVGVNVTGLRAGQYSGLIRVNAPGAGNSPQFVSVDLNVLPAGSRPEVRVRPTGLVFAAQAGASPGSQTVRVGTATPGSTEFLSGLVAFGGEWLEAHPRNAVISPTTPRTITVQPSAEDLAAGIYRGALTLLFADGSRSQVVDVLFVVVPPGGASSEAGYSTAGHRGEACAPTRLVAGLRTLANSFSSPVGWPSPIEAQVLDDCGTAVTNATVLATFSNGDAPLPLTNLRNGLYIGTWRPLTAAAQVTVTTRATSPGLAPAEVQVLGQVGASVAPLPLLFTGGVVSGASFAPAANLAPGAIVSVFGRNLAAGLNFAPSLPLATSLGGASLNVSGIDVPLFFSSEGQINAQLPFELAPNGRPQVFVRARSGGTGVESVTVPETITIAPAQPACFTTNQQGTGQGAILDVQGRLVDGAAPAGAGEVVQVFCTGLGATNPAVPSGQAAPGEPLAHVVATVTATVGGQPAVVHFAGLAPGFVGLYQVNVQIPVGVAPGNAVPLVLTQGGVPSNTVTLGTR